jgi:hypothetical protein
VLQEYLSAAYSLKEDGLRDQTLHDDVRAAHSEIMRIALGEMRHLRAVNLVLANLLGRPKYKPALGVATRIPAAKPGTTRPTRFAALTPDVLDDFIAIEAPSQSVDSVYSRILATLERLRKDNDIQAVRTIMTEGEDHYQTFLSIREWLARHKPAQYLRGTKTAPAGNAANKTLQARYAQLLDLLYKGYARGMPDGATNLNNARNFMVDQNSGIAAAAAAVAAQGFLVTFSTPNDKRFAPVKPP